MSDRLTTEIAQVLCMDIVVYSRYRLRIAGLLAGESTHDARIRYRLYQNYLEKHLPHDT